jgi:alpha-L-fucosidase
VKQLVDIYYHSIGRNASLLLNFPVDQRGLIHEKDVEQLMKMVEVIRADLAYDLAWEAKIEASQVRGGSGLYDAGHVADGDPETYWATDDSVITASLTFDFGEELTFNRFLVQEYIPLGQRVKEFSLEAWVDGAWVEIDRQTTIGAKRILRFENLSSSRLRFTILDAKACPTISNVEIYHAPKLLEPPVVERDKQGMVRMESFDSGLEIYYTLDGTDPDENSAAYTGSFSLKGKGEIRAMVFDPASEGSSGITQQDFDICKENWKVLSPDPAVYDRVGAAIDASPRSLWRSEAAQGLPQAMIVDLGETLVIEGFTYLPSQERYIDGTISQYKLYLSQDGTAWGQPVASGEFSNIRNSPVLQRITFEPRPARYFKFVAEREINDATFASIAELGIITAEKE